VRQIPNVCMCWFQNLPIDLLSKWQKYVWLDICKAVTIYARVLQEKMHTALNCIPQTTPLITFTHVIIISVVRITLRIIILYYARGRRFSFKKGLYNFYLAQTFPSSGHRILTAVKRRAVNPIFIYGLQNKCTKKPP